jgi:hypothetical protein
MNDSILGDLSNNRRSEVYLRVLVTSSSRSVCLPSSLLRHLQNIIVRNFLTDEPRRNGEPAVVPERNDGFLL